MIAEVIIDKLGKRFKQYANHWARLAEWLTLRRYCGHVERWALRNISFQVQAGEAVGIIGQNGAGKSTLLKILTGTTLPTEGSIQIGGRVAAILELGMGFHPDFSGRQNAVLACQMSGILGEKIKTLLPEIESFSELGDYFDQPLRVYSTGMQMRLAFSTATVARPDILVVDEALSVGDAYFQHKCMRRIRNYKQQGTTLLFVSHDASAVKSLCNRAILLDQGQLIQDGTPNSVLDYYNAMIAKKSKDEEIKQIETNLHQTITRSGSRLARIQKVEMLNEIGRPARAFQVGDRAQICCDIAMKTSLQNPTVGILIRDRLGNDAFGTNTYHLTSGDHAYSAGDMITVTYHIQLNLGPGNYSLTVAVHAGETHMEDSWDWWDQCLAFQIIPNDAYHFIGVAALPAEVHIAKGITK